MAKVVKILKSGESIGANDCLVSPDGRFRLYVEKDGNVVAYCYSTERGIWRFYRFEISSPVPGSRLELGMKDLGAYGPHLRKAGAPMVKGPDGAIVWVGIDHLYEYLKAG